MACNCGVVQAKRDCRLHHRDPDFIEKFRHKESSRHNLVGRIQSVLLLNGLKFHAAKLDAFAVQPKLADDLRQHHRYNAACIAALALPIRVKTLPSSTTRNAVASASRRATGCGPTWFCGEKQMEAERRTKIEKVSKPDERKRTEKRTQYSSTICSPPWAGLPIKRWL